MNNDSHTITSNTSTKPNTSIKRSHPIGFRIYDDALEVVRMVRPYRIAIEKEDPDQARQLRRSSKSIPYNIAEAYGGRGKNQKARLTDALTSARETLTNLEVAVADGIIEGIDEVLRNRLNRIIGSLVKLSRASRQQ